MVTRDTTWPAGTPCWSDLTTTDPRDAMGFYTELFGWTYEQGAPETGPYCSAQVGGRNVAGVNGFPSTDVPPAWLTYLATDDIAASAAAVAAAGGTTYVEPMQVMDSGHMAIMADPSGLGFGLWQGLSHTGFERANEPNTVVWNEMLSRDPETTMRFYREVFGVDFEPVDMPAGMSYWLMKLGADMVGGLTTMPEQMPAEVPPHWAVYVAVEDTDDTVDRTVKLGGSVRQPAWDTPWGRMAALADVQGAGFSVMTPPSS